MDKQGYRNTQHWLSMTTMVTCRQINVT